MTVSFGATITQAELNSAILLFCHFYKHQDLFEYSPEEIECECCNVKILNGIYSDEELIVETPLRIQITDERFPIQNYRLAFDYYNYKPDTDDELPALQRQFFDLELDENGIAEITLEDTDVIYIMLENWELVTSFDKPVIEEVTS
jgi:hypothetical protein